MRPLSLSLPLAIRLALAALLLALAPRARADVGVFPMQVTGFEDDAVVADGLEANVRVVLGDRKRDVPWRPGCAEDPRCIAEIARELPGIDEFLLVSAVRQNAMTARVVLRVLEPSGQELFTLEQAVGHAESATDVEALLRRAFDPARYSGTIEVVGLPEGAELLVDGLVLENTTAPLRVGQHVWEVRRPGHPSVESPFAIAFAKTTRVDLSTAVETASMPRVAWPGYAAAGVGVVGVAAAVTSAIVLGLVLPEQRQAWQAPSEGRAELAAADDPAGAAFDSGYGGSDAEKATTRSFVSVAVAANHRRQVDAQTRVFTAALIGSSALALAGGSAALATWLGGAE